jgi:hypothetical protein
MHNRYRRHLGSIVGSSLPSVSASSGSIAAQAAAATAAAAASTANKPQSNPNIVDVSGTVAVVQPAATSVAQQVANAIAQQAPTAAQSAAAAATALDAASIQDMHDNPSLVSNQTSYLMPWVIDYGGVGAPPSYIALPQYPPVANSQNPGTFPYNNPPPHWTPNLKWWTGQTILNVGVPAYSNDPWEYLRSALVDSNMSMFQIWCDWFLAEAGKPANTPYASAQPWAAALQSIDLSQHKYIQTSEGPVFLPFSYADLTAIQQATQQFEYGYDEATLATYLQQWVTQVLPDVSQFPAAIRLNVATGNPPQSPYPSNYLPAIFRQGSTFLASAMPYIPVLTIALGGALGYILAAGSGVASAASDAADITTDVGTDALTAGADAGLTAAGDVGGETLAEVVVTAAAPAIDLTGGAVTALTAAAAAGATLPEVIVSGDAPPAPSAGSGGVVTISADLPEVIVSANPAPTSVSSDDDLDAGLTASEIAQGITQPQVNYPSNNSALPSPSSGSLLSALAKLLGGGGTGQNADGSDGGVTGSDGGSLGDWLANLTATEWLLILAAGGAGMYFIHESRPKRKAH